MSKRIDLAGGRFGRLVVLSEAPQVGKDRYWNCRCDCGKEKPIPMKNLRSGKTKSCGCLAREKLIGARFKDLTDMVFGRLTVIKKDGDRRINKSVAWICQCECDRVISVPSRDLIHGNTKSCGCLNIDLTRSLQAHNEQHKSVDGVFVPLLQQKVQTNSITGVKGVSIRRVKNKKDKYIVNIEVKGVRHYLGIRNNLEDAIALRESGEEKYHKPYIDKHQKREDDKREP